MTDKEEENKLGLNFPPEYWQVFNAKFSVRPMSIDKDLFRHYQLINQSDGTKYGKPMDMMEFVEFMNKSYEEYQRELEKIILG